MKQKLTALIVALVMLCSCAGMQVDQKKVVETTFESAAFMVGNIGVRKYPVAFHAAALIGQMAMASPAWDLATAETTVNDIWKEIQPYMSVDPAMMHLSQKWLGIVAYDPETKIINIPQEYVDFVRNCIAEFVVGVQMAGGV